MLGINCALVGTFKLPLEFLAHIRHLFERLFHVLFIRLHLAQLLLNALTVLVGFAANTTQALVKFCNLCLIIRNFSISLVSQ